MNILRSELSEQAGIQKKVFTKKLNPNEVVKNANDLAKFVEALETSNIEKLQRGKNIVEYFKTTKDHQNMCFRERPPTKILFFVRKNRFRPKIHFFAIQLYIMLFVCNFQVICQKPAI